MMGYKRVSNIAHFSTHPPHEATIMPPDDVSHLHARIKDLEAALGLQNQKDPNLAVTYGLTPALSKLLGLLMSVKIAEPSLIQQRLEVVTDAKVAVHRLRRRLEPFGITIQGRRGVGYWLDEDTKELLRQRVTSGVTAAPDSPPPEPPTNVIPFPTPAPESEKDKEAA